MRILLSILIALSPVLGYAQTTGKIIETNGFLGTISRKNYVKNPNAEKNTSDVSVTGTNASVTASTSSPYFDTKAFRFGGNIGGTITGTFAFNNFSPGMIGGGTNCYTSYWMSIDSNGTMTVNMKLGSTTVATQTIDATITGVPVKQYFLYYACGETSQTPSLEFSFATTAGNAANLWNVDEVFGGYYDGPSSMANNTEWTSYTPTLNGFTASGSNYCQYQQNGSKLAINCKIVKTAHSAAEMRVGLPTGYTSAGTGVIPSIQITGGVFATNANSVANAYTYAALIEPSVTYMTFGIQGTANQGLVKQNGNNVFGATDTFSFQAVVPIASANNIPAIPASCINNPDCQNTFSAKVSSAGVVSDENYSWINGNCTMSGGVSACTYDTSRFSVAPNCVVTAANTGAAAPRYFAVSSTASAATTNLFNTSTTGTNTEYNIVCTRAGTDVKPWGPIPWLTGMVSSNSTGVLRHEFARITGGNPPTIGNQSDTAWLTFSTRTAAGDYTFTHNLGAQPECSIAGVVAASRRFVRFQTLSSTTIRTTIEDSAGTGSDTDFSLMCSVKRP